MRLPHLSWHIYPQEQIRPELGGNLAFVLEVPWSPNSPVLRNIFDPTGTEFPRASFRLLNLERQDHHGILYAGVNRAAVCDLMLSDPQLLNEAPDYALYNRQIVANARNFFLLDPNLGFKSMPQHMAHLL